MITSAQIAAVVCTRLDVPIERFKHTKGGVAAHAVTEARQVASWLMRVILNMSFPEIARFIGLASHRDVFRMVKRLSESDRLSEIAGGLWFELEPPVYRPSDISLRRGIVEFERDVGLQMVR